MRKGERTVVVGLMEAQEAQANECLDQHESASGTACGTAATQEI